MKRRVLVTALALGVGVSGARANPGQISPMRFAGSDTLFELTTDVVNTCGLSASLKYVGGGSGLGGNRMNPGVWGPAAGQQQVAPQSRFLSPAECSNVSANAGQGIAVALDGIGIWHDATEGSSCNVLRYKGCMTVTDRNFKGVDANADGDCDDAGDTPGICFGLSTTAGQIDHGIPGETVADEDAATPGVQYCFTHWSEALRIVYTGQHAHVTQDACTLLPTVVAAATTRRCNSDVRRSLVDTWSNMFDTVGGGGDGGCADGHCSGLKHAYRRDDLSGTTDTFLSLIGVTGVGTVTAPVKTFCNGIENEDLDPIRRDCNQGNTSALDADSVCSALPMRNRNLPFDAASGNPTGAGTANLAVGLTSATQLFQPKTACAAVADCTAAGAPTSATCVSGFCQVPSISDLGVVLAVSPIPSQINDVLLSTTDAPVTLKVCAANAGTASKVGAYCTADASCSVSPDPVVAGSCAVYNPQYDQTACTAALIGSGRVSLAEMPFSAIANSQRCPNGSSRSGNKCLWPTRAASLTNGTANWWNCKTKRTNRVAGGANWGNYDARAYNWVPRHPQTGALLLPDTTAGTGGVKDPRFTGGGSARINMQLPDTALAGHPACTRSDATDQIGCLVEADPCSIGYAGLQAGDPDNTVAGMNASLLLGKVDGSGEVAATTDRIQDLSDSCGNGLEGRYPIARILWLNASKGFGVSAGGSTIPTFTNILNTVDSDPGDDVLGFETAPNDTDTTNEPDGIPDLLTREQDLTACYAAQGTPATAAAAGSLVLKHHFIPLPSGANRIANCVAGSFSFISGSTW